MGSELNFVSFVTFVFSLIKSLRVSVTQRL